MRLFDPFSSAQKAETIRKNNISNSVTGAYGSGGSLRNPMYRNVCCDGIYETMTGRKFHRACEKRDRKKVKALQRENKSVSKFHKGFA